MAYTTSITIRGYHCDAYGHVNNARYFEIFEEARWQALETAGLIPNFEELGLQFFVVNINSNFKKAILPNDIATVQTSLGATTRRTISFIQEITVNGLLCTKAEVIFVLFDAEAKRATPITKEILALFTSFIHGKS